MKNLSKEEQMTLWRDLVQNNSPCEVVTNAINDQLNEWKCENVYAKKHGQMCVNCKYNCDQKKCDLCCKITYLRKTMKEHEINKFEQEWSKKATEILGQNCLIIVERKFTNYSKWRAIVHFYEKGTSGTTLFVELNEIENKLKLLLNKILLKEEE